MDSYRLHAYSLQILNVKMKVKFQCRMIIEYNGQPITTDVPPQHQNIFQFNQNVNISQQPNSDYLLLNLSLLTQKGAKYIAAEIAIYFSELIKGDGARLTFPLAKCLDPQAKIEIKVISVTPTRIQGQRKGPDYRHTEINQRNYQPLQIEQQPIKPMYSPNAVGTRSEVNFSNGNFFRDQRSHRKKAQQMSKSRSKSRSMFKRVNSHRYMATEEDPQPFVETLREKYKESYEKLKYHLKNESQRNRNEFQQRMALENNEMLMKMKTKYSLVVNQLELTKQKLKNTQGGYENQLKKISSELHKCKAELDKQLIKYAEEKEKSTKLQLEFNQSEMKVKMLMEKYDKENRNWNEKFISSENSIARYKQENNRLLDKVNKLSEKEHHYCHNFQHVNHQKMENHKIIQRLRHQVESYKSQLRQIEFKHTQTSNHNQLINNSKGELHDQFKRLQMEYSKVCGLYKEARSENDRISGRTKELQRELQALRSEIREKDDQIRNAKNNLGEESRLAAESKEKLLRNELALENSVKQARRFKDYLMETINSAFEDVQLTSFHDIKRINSMDLQTMNSKQTINFWSNSQQTYNNSDILNRIRFYAKEYKNLFSRLSADRKQMENEKIAYKRQLQEAQSRFSEELHKNEQQITDLQRQLAAIFTQNDNTQVKLMNQNRSLKQKLIEIEEQITVLRISNEQKEFNINGLKMEKESELQNAKKTLIDFRNKIVALEQRKKSLISSESKLEKKIHQLSLNNTSLQEDIEELREENKKKELKIQQISSQIQKKDGEIESLKGQKKNFMSEILQLQMILNNEKQHNAKYSQLLTQQQKRSTENKQFISSLIKQKEILVKADLKKESIILELEQKIERINEQLQNCEEMVRQKKQTIEQQKLTNKKNQLRLKQFEEDITGENERSKKLLQKLRQKEQQLKVITQLAEVNGEKSRKDYEIKVKQLKELKNQYQILESDLKEERNQFHISETLFSEELEEKQKILEEYKRLKEEAEEQIEKLQGIIQSKENENQFLRNAYKQFQKRVFNNEKKYQELDEGFKSKQEQVYSLSDEKYALEVQLADQQEKYKEQIKNIDNNWDFKFQALIEDYEGKLEQLQKEKDYHKAKNIQFQEQNHKLSQQNKLNQIQANSERMISQERMKRLDEERNTMIQSLKSEIQHLQNQVRLTQEIEKKKNIEIQQLKNNKTTNMETINKLELRIHENQRKIDTIQSSSYIDQQNLHKKQLQFKKYQQAVSNCQWVIEREIRKQLQGFTRKIISGVQGQENKRLIIDSIKEMEKGLGKVVQSKISQVKSH